MQIKGKTSCSIAKDRLKQLVLTDRMGCTPEMLELLKRDMAASISRYMDVDKEKIVFSIQREQGQFTASVPVCAISGRRTC